MEVGWILNFSSLPDPARVGFLVLDDVRGSFSRALSSVALFGYFADGRFPLLGWDVSGFLSH